MQQVQKIVDERIDAVEALQPKSGAEICRVPHGGGTMIVPAHGRVADSADVAYYRDMVTIIRDRVQDMVNRKLSLEQVKAAKPTADYDPRYGAGEGRWTSDQFIGAVYRSLQARTPARAPAASAPRGRT